MSVTAALTGLHNELHEDSHHSRLNWLRAGILGANDGIVSVSALVLGVIAAGASKSAILTAGFASLVAGAVSMALGEYVSVSAQRDSEKIMIAKERQELAEVADEEEKELAEILNSYGISEATAKQASREIHTNDALAAHLRLELGIDSDDLTSAWAAAGSSAVSFVLGAALPLLAVLLSPAPWATPLVTAVTLIALVITGYVSAAIARTPKLRSCLRLAVGGALGLALTYGAGALFGG